ncbi:hypothetical protein ACRQ1B_22525 [Rhizobium panacihumi]|uniref:hypothetical protein n=1 Tax=Rhizobium panacihumi TaxID=2008450 RepID=UPI003D7B9485
MSETSDFRATPLFRLTSTYEDDLDKLSDPALEGRIVERLGERLAEAQTRRDNNLKSLFIIDMFLAIAVSGKNFKIPGTDISTLDLPAALEILVAISTFGLLITAAGFTTWLCYSQLLWAVMQRTARAADIDGGILADTDHFNEMSVRLFQSEIAIAGKERFTPKRGFRALLWIYEFCYKIVFGIIPIMHILLVGYGLRLIFERSGYDPLHLLLYLTVFLGHVLALIIWFAPNMEFGFKMRHGPYTRKGQ